MENVIKFSSEIFEKMVLCYSIKNENFLINIKEHLTTKNYKKKAYFNDTKNQIIFNIISLWHTKYSSIPSQSEVKIFIERINEDNEIKELLSVMVDRLYSEDISTYNETFLKEETEKFIRQQKLIEAFAISQSYVEEAEIEKIVDTISSVDVDIFNKHKVYTSVSNKQNIDDIIKRLDEEDKLVKISSGYPKLDEALDGGFRPSSFYVFAAKSGGGKSIMLLQFAINAVKQGKKVLYISLEMDDLTITHRINLNLLSNDYPDKAHYLMAYKCNAKQLKKDLAETRKDLTGELIVQYSYNLGITVNDFKKFIGKNHYDMILVDYIGIMNSFRHPTEENPHFKYRYIAEELRQLATDLEIPVLTANQLNAEGFKTKSKEMSLTNLSYSGGIGFTADFVAAITPDGECINVLKSRNGTTPLFSIDMNKAKYKIEDIYDYEEKEKDREEKIEKVKKEYAYV